MKTKIQIKIFDTKKIKPEKYLTVLIEGCCAFWDGKNWFPVIVGYNLNSPIAWEVKWWANLIHLNT